MQLSKIIAVYKVHTFPVWDVRFCPVGYYFASASNDRTAAIWCTSFVTPQRLCVGHLSDVETVQWHPNCRYIVTGSSDKTIRM